MLERKPATLSGGEQQRVAIGRALIRRPKLLLLDEPLTNLDAKLRHDTRAEFKRLHRELGMTMVYATPDQLEALSMGERIAMLRAGEIVQVGTPRDLYAAPADRFVATLVGAPAMNLLPATLHHAADGPVARLPFVDLPLAHRRQAADYPAGAERADRHPAARSRAGTPAAARTGLSRPSAPDGAARRRHRDRRRRRRKRC